MIRKPAVAGHFYPAGKEELLKMVKGYLRPDAKKGKALGVISPHAGYIYSGGVAGAVLSEVEIPPTVIIISPNHTGRGTPASIMTNGEWETPLGSIKIDGKMAEGLLKGCPDLKGDALAHIFEHSIEVQLPFLQVIRPDVKIVPITVSHLRFETCEQIAHAIANSIHDGAKYDGAKYDGAKYDGAKYDGAKYDGAKLGRETLIIASSDMTHYEPFDVAKEKDFHAIERVLALDARGLLNTCAEEDITMCGVVPAAIMILAVRELGAGKGRLIKYATSGDVTNDYAQVVGYAGIVVGS